MAIAEVSTPRAAPPKDLYDIGEIPPLGHVPAKMYAWAIRKERHGPPETSFQIEVVPTWDIADDEVLVFVMAAGVNYNGVWAGLGTPISPIDGHKNPYHIAGSDASGIVWAVGDKVKRWKVGDEVIVHCNQDDGDDEDCNGGDPLLSPSQRIWGYETPDGSFAQFCRVQSRQLMPKPEASDLGRIGLLHAHARDRLPHAVRPRAAHAQARRQRAGLGRVRRARRVRSAAGRGVGRERDRGRLRRAKAEYVFNLGAKGVDQPQGLQVLGPDADRRLRPSTTLDQGSAQVRQGDLGDHRQARRRHRVRASGRATFPVSCLVVKRGGMVVFCAGTTGYNLTFDARYVWMRQKRIQGSHFAHLKQASAANQFVLDRRIDPCLSKTFTWDKIPAAHQMMWKNQHPPGNMAVLVNAPRPGCRTLEDAMEPAFE